MKRSKHPSRTASAAELVQTCHRLYRNGLVVATDGNISVRLPNGNILATGSSISKGAVTRSNLVEISLSGEKIRGGDKASTELGMHLFVYQERTDVHAVVHAHPVYATAFAVAGIPLDRLILPEVVVGLGIVPLASYATPSTPEVARSLAPFVKSHDAILLANHGVVTCGSSLSEAYHKMEKVEQAAKISFLARMLGGERTLTREEVRKLMDVSPQSYGKEIPEMILDAIKA
jgi:L-fuculose-phosphate aldolase